MTDTDLITAGESTDGKPSDAAATDPPDLNADEPAARWPPWCCPNCVRWLIEPA